MTANLTYPKYLSKPLVDLLKKIFEVNPKNRITINQIKQHSWFKLGFTAVKGTIDRSKSNEDNIQYVEEDVEKTEFAIKELYKEIDYSKIAYLNCFEMSTLLSGKWVTKMFDTSEKGEIIQFINKKSFYLLGKTDMPSFLKYLHVFMANLCQTIKYNYVMTSKVSANNLF